MITSFIITLLYYAINLLLSPISLLGDVVLNTNFTTTLTTAGGYLSSLNNFLPVDTMITILGISLTFELAYITYKVIMWVIKKIPFIN
jgi:hypothetical protein